MKHNSEKKLKITSDLPYFAKPFVSGSLFDSVYVQYERISATIIVATK